MLYLSCHEILEYDELRMFTDLGVECYSLGAYTHPGGVENRKRPPLPNLPYDPHFIELATRYGKQVHPEMLESIDVVVVMHTPDFIRGNALVFKDFVSGGGRVIWRSIGQSQPSIEMELDGWRLGGCLTDIVRYSPREETIAWYAGADAMIRFCKRSNDFKPWTGNFPVVVNFTQSMIQRADHVGYAFWQEATTGLNRRVYGPGNEGLSDSGGLLSYECQLNVLRGARCMFYTGTYPAAYTLSFVEAVMAGLPIVAVGPVLGNSRMYPDQACYEIPEILMQGVRAMWSDDLLECRESVKYLLDYHEAARYHSTANLATAKHFFSEERIAPQWKELLSL